MLKVQKNYEPTDFSALLQELQEKSAKEKSTVLLENEISQETAGVENFSTDIVTGEHTTIEKFPKEESTSKIVSIHRKRRQSQLDNVRMRYVYSKEERVLHDRSCEYVWRIPDEEFQMKADFTLEMPLCPYCQRQAVIRAGIGDDGKRIGAYNWFFNHAQASAGDLYNLIISHGASLKWIDKENMQIHVNEDTWIIRNKNGKLKLYHNNYYVADGMQRLFESGFHQQSTGGKTDFHSIVKIMCDYTWDRHLEGKRAEKERQELIAGAAQGTLELENYWQEPRWSLRYVHMVYLDHKNCMGDEILKKMGIRPIYEKEYTIPDLPVKVIYCRIPRKQRLLFDEAMKALACELIKDGHVNYAVACKKVKTYLDSVQRYG